MPPTQLKIGKAAEAAGVSAKTLRYYEDIGLVRARRSDNGYRMYDGEAVDRVRFISQSKSLGFSLGEVKTILDLRDADVQPCGHVAGLMDRRIAALESFIGELTALKSELQRLRSEPSHCEVSAPGSVCSIIEAASIKRRA